MPTKEQLESALVNADKAGDVQAAKAIANELKAMSAANDHSVFSQVTGALPTIISGGLADAAGGIAEVSAALHEGSSRGREAGDFVREKLTIKPNEAGQQGLEHLGEFISEVKELPVIKPVVERGGDALEGNFIRNQLVDVGLPPEIAGSVASLPKGALEAIGVLLTGGALNTTAKGIQSGVKTAANTSKDLALSTANTLPTIPQKAAEGAVSLTHKTGEMIGDAADKVRPSQIEARKAALEAFQSGNLRDPDTARFRLEGDRVVPHERASEALRQGFSEETVAYIKAANQATRDKGLRMVAIRDSGLRGQTRAARNRASDIVGESIGERLRFIRRKNREAAAQLNRASRNLKGKPIDVTPASESLKDALEGLGVKFDRDNMDVSAFDFSESAIAQLPALQGTLKRFVKSLAEAGKVDAYKAHIFKRQIDNIVDYGKNSSKPITKDVDDILKTFRHDLNQAIRGVSTDYAKANDLYAETITVIKEAQDLLGRKYNVFHSDEQLGLLSRRVLSNAQSTGLVRDVMDEVDALANKYAGSGKLPVIPGQGGQVRFNDDMMTLVDLFVELDGVAGIAAKTSHAASVGQGVKQATRGGSGAADAAIDVLSEEVNAVRAINPKSGLKAMRDLLNNPE